MISQITQIDLDMKDEQTQAIIGVAMKVHRELGCGFLERVYQCAFAVDLKASTMRRALLINFGGKSLEFKRFVN